MNKAACKDDFLDIIHKYQGILYKVSLVYFKNEADRADNFQEIIYQLWKSFPDLKNRNSIGSWIYAVAINTSIAKLRKESRIEICESLPEVYELADQHKNLETKEEQKLLIEAIQKLNAIEKSVILLYLEEKSYDEIAEILGITPSNVGVKINRIKVKIKTLINYGNR